MSNKQQTAVDFYKKEVVELAVQLQYQKIDLYEFLVEIQKLEQQAKELEKQQMIDFAKNYERYSHQQAIASRYNFKQDAEQYYKETYGE